MESIERIYQKYAKQIYNYILYISHYDIELAEEITQETFYSAIKNINKFRGECEISTWLHRIAKNLYYKNIKKSKKLKKIEQIEENEQLLKIDGIENEIIYKQDKSYIYKEIEKLDEVSRKIVLLRITYDLSFNQISKIIGKTETFARVKFYRAKEKLKIELNNVNEERMK